VTNKFENGKKYNDKNKPLKSYVKLIKPDNKIVVNVKWLYLLLY